MRIALIHYSSAPIIGGVETVLAAHARHFRQAGHEVLVISQRGDADVRLEPLRAAETCRRKLRDVLRNCDVAFVHNVMTMPFDLELTAALEQTAAELVGVRFVAWVHDVAAVNPDLAPVPEVLRRALNTFTYVTVSAARAREFQGITGVAPRVVPNGIEPAQVLGLTVELADLAEKFDLFADGPVLFHPTRLLRRKNVELGTQVIAEMRATGAKLLITAAEDPHNPASQDYSIWLRAQSTRLGVEDRVIFVADHLPIDDAELAGLYRLADALFLPSRQEGFGLPVLEAALHRIPAFVSKLPSLTEVAGANCWSFSLDDSLAEVTSLIAATLENDGAFQARKHALHSRWSRIYEVHIAPLLSGN